MNAEPYTLFTIMPSLRDSRLALVVAAVASLSAASAMPAQTASDNFRSTADRDLLTRLVAAEDRRARNTVDLTTLRSGLRAENPAIRRFAVRGLGRLERAELIRDIAGALADPDAGVRSAAADALAQSASHGLAAAAREALGARLNRVRDAGVLASIAESLGSLTADRNEAAATAQLLIGL